MSKQIGAKRSQKQHDILILHHAVDAVQSKSMSLRAASKHYGIPTSTLHDKVHGKTPMSRPSKTILTTAEEQRLVDWVLHMARIGYGRTRQEVLDTVKRIIDADERPNPFKDNRPGKDWWYGFVKRHPEMTERLPQDLGKERATITQAKVQRWFEEFEHYVRNEIKDPTILQDPSRSSTVYHFTSSDKTQITVLACMSATGHFLKPLIVYPGQRFAYNPLEGFPEAVMGRTDNGWMDADLFATWLTDVFIPSINERGVRKPVVLFVDGHSTHVSMRVSDICRQGGIELYCLLEHASHLMQPCDLRLFSVLKDSWKQAVRDYQFQNIGEHVTKKTFASVFKTAWEKATTVSVAVHGFRDSGLFPLNASKVLSTCKMDPSNIFHPYGTQTVSASGAADESQVLPAAQENANNTVNVQQEINTDKELTVTATTSTDVPQHAPLQPAAATVQDLSNDRTPQVSTAVELVLKIPVAKPSEKRPMKKENLPKAVTGEKFREILEEKRKRKEQEEADKQERKRQRELRKQQKDEERKQKLEQKEAKKKAREEQRRLNIQKKLQKQVEKQYLKRKNRESESSSDSDVDMPKLSDESDIDIDVDVTRKCYVCEEVYDDSIFWIACNKCPRMFHRRCVKTIDLCAMTEDEIEALQFECDFC
ncbi:uncharacterized protein LOC123562153 [Mercenaria mercenaria]|uniref:uncharacterized protein LOC123562153 n=1 Tax=Mercenaria mercenaria TaxID=6596 RepID=UPI00234FA9F2|nr:uncharacterized protein LOC123562153 [Mercenaria mercenaria]